MVPDDRALGRLVGGERVAPPSRLMAALETPSQNTGGTALGTAALLCPGPWAGSEADKRPVRERSPRLPVRRFAPPAPTLIARDGRDVPAGKPIHLVLDNYATHKHPKGLAWLARHPRWTFHFTDFRFLAH
jgi:hypothetical protein